MTSRERYRRALEFDSPDRVPREMWWLPVAELEHGREAVAELRARWPGNVDSPEHSNPDLEALTQGEPFKKGIYKDEWGCVFVNLQDGVVGEVKEPILQDWSRLEDIRVPIERLLVDRETVNRSCAASDKFMLAPTVPRPFERIQFLRGSENVYMDLGLESPELMRLIEILHELYCRELEVWGKTDVDCLQFMDDWGSQKSLLISPALWRRIFKPLYADYARIAKEHGKKIMMHSDGYIFDIYEDLIEIGIDAINSQLFCMDIEEIGRRFAGRIAFRGEIDRQHILPHGTVEECRAAVRRVVDNLYRPQGGVIAQFELGAGVRIENADAIFQAWEDFTPNG